MNGWDFFAITSAIAIRDYFRDKDKEREKIAKYYNQIYKEISRESSRFLDAVEDIINSVGVRTFPHVIRDGIALMPIYAFYRVLENQVASPTKEQHQLMDVFFKSLTLPFDKSELISAARGRGRAKTILNDTVGVSKGYVGAFWRELFKMIYASEFSEDVVRSITDPFTSIVMRFSILGTRNSDVALPICQDFVVNMYDQISEHYSKSDDDYDFYGAVPFLQHKKNVESLVTTIDHCVDDPEAPNATFSLPYFLSICLKDIIDLSSAPVYKKIEMLDEIMKLSDICICIEDQTIDAHRFFSG